MRCRNSELWRIATSMLLIASVASSQSVDSVAGHDRVSQFLAAGKYEQAELFCRQRLSATRPAPVELANNVCDLIHVLTERARRAADETVDQEWAKVRAASTQYLELHGDSSCSILVQLQAAMAEIAEAEQMLGQVRVEPDRLRTRLRLVSRELEQLSEEVELRLRQSHSVDQNADDSISRKALRAVRAALRQQRSTALLMLASTDDASESDRSYACTRAREELERISPGDLSEKAWWRSRVALVRCHRLRQDWNAAARLLKEASAAPAAAGIQPLLEAERLRLEIAQRHWPAVRKLIAASAELAGPELALARFEATLMLATQAEASGDSNLVASLQSNAAELLPKLESQFGSWWRRRADKQLLKLAAGSIESKNLPGSSSSELAAAVGRSLLAEGRRQEAAAQLMKAAEDAKKENRVVAVRLAHQAAAIAWDAQHWIEAQEYYLALANTIEESDVAASASHLMAVRCAANRALESADHRAEYAKLLAEHLSRWPELPTAVTTRRWQAKLAEQERDWNKATTLYLSVLQKKGDKVSADAAVRCVKNAVRVGTLRDDEAVTIARHFIDSTDTDRSTTDLAILVVAMRIHANFARSTPESLAARLQAAVESAAGEAGTAEQARLLLIEHAARHGRADDAARQLNGLKANGESELALESLSRLAKLDSLEVAGLRLRLIDLYRPADEGKAIVSRWESHRAAALLDSSKVAESIKSARRCVALAPHSSANQLLLATCLLASSDESAHRQAAGISVQLVRGLKRGSSDWFRAKLLLAESWIAVHETAKAEQLLRLTNALYPSWGSSQNHTKYSALFARLGQE